MGRTVVTSRDVQAARARGIDPSVTFTATSAQAPDGYKDRLLKYIPAEIVAIYLAILNIVKGAAAPGTPVITVEWVVFGVLLLASVPWQRKILKVTKWQQIGVGTAAFFFWALTLGDPFQTSWQGWYQPVFGTIAMMLYTFLIPLFEPA